MCVEGGGPRMITGGSSQYWGSVVRLGGCIGGAGCWRAKGGFQFRGDADIGVLV